MNFHSNFTDLSIDRRKFREDKKKMLEMKLEQEAIEKKRLNDFTIKIRR
jgi:hypothetical protein